MILFYYDYFTFWLTDKTKNIFLFSVAFPSLYVGD